MKIDDNNLFFLTLPPPGSEGSAHTQLATNIHGVPIGETDGRSVLAVTLGYSDKDTIGSALDDVKALAGQLNIAIADPKYASVDYLVVYLKQVDPKNPNLPPINSLLVLSKEMLKQGNIGGTQVIRGNFQTGQTQLGNAPPLKGSEDPNAGISRQNEATLSKFIQDGVEVSRQLNKEQIGEVQLQRTQGGNKFLGGLNYLAFLIAFMEMQRVLMRSKEVQGKIELASMEMIKELANHTGALIIEIAQENQKIHLATAIASGLSIGMTFGFGLAGADLTVTSTIMSQIEKTISSGVQAGTDIGIARREAMKEAIQAVRTIIQRQMEKAGEAFKANEDKISQNLQALDKMRESLHQSIAASLRK